MLPNNAPAELLELSSVDLVVDQVYGGSRKGNASDDPLPALLGVDSGAGFRHLGRRPAVGTLKLLVLKTDFSTPEWPDSMDRENGRFVYYGDRRTPGDIHATPRDGNLILCNLFAEAHGKAGSEHFPPILLFGRAGVYRDVRFLGLAVPGAMGMSSDEDLVAVWRTTADGQRFQNYKATFTVLNVPIVSRAWLHDVAQGNAVSSPYAPAAWLEWVRGRKLAPLLTTRVSKIRLKHQQLPSTEELSLYVSRIREFYREDPYGFERCAMEIARMFMPNIREWEITRPWRDGGRDAVGTYRIGSGAGSIDVEFALEAKCYAPSNGVGVRPLSRLLSRLRHRQFGILVTTSFLDRQAYDELVEDQHPVIVIAAADIAEMLKARFGGPQAVQRWLEQV